MIKQFIVGGQSFSSAAAHWLKQHPKRITAIVAALLLSGGGGAFAVASLGPDAADLPVQEIMETVLPLALPDYNHDVAPAYVLYRTDHTRTSDTADTLLKRLGIDDAQAAAYLRNDSSAHQMLLGRSGRQITAEATHDQQLNKLSARWSSDTNGEFKRLVIERQGDHFVTRIETAALSASSQLASGTIQSSLFAASDEAKIPDAIAVQLAEIFSGDIDFRRELRKGDQFSVVYETLEGDGEPLRTGRVLSAEFVNAGKSYQAMWFDEPVAGQAAGGMQSGNPSSKGAYYTLGGQSLRRAFLSSPVAFSRVSSGFAMRFHPILKQMRAHLGTDFAASTGTPARTVGDGIVTFSGVQNGYGNVVFIKHRGNTETVYAHLSKLLVRRGERVEQGQTIGLVGSTGWATGPHLHFEVRNNGVQQDPMKVAKQSESVPVTAAVKPAFDQLAQQARVALAAAATLEVSSTQ
ncbi:M23 family metallopeptidase [Rhodoferax sp.]|uniref:M23 family metallopeptidase n=1 Tax=Rhodoferax sp. TaxID=50421 RepID=UPI002718753B|nr:M23 family metallopeptidase [Rhodoferax sp.]MDO8319372.1 peptidoglycan DD-metalloendopeptidase family protein [Rhodoferax sp.]